jgi:UDP-glucose 4-epimerase
VNQGIRIVFASTRQIYGKPDYLPVDEEHPIRPVDVNGVNKMAGEAYHILYNNVYGISSCALRLTNTYGPRMRVKDARQTFLGVWIKRILQEEPIEVWEGSQLRDFTYVDDCVEALLKCASEENARGRVFNLGGTEDPIALKDLAALLIEINGSGQHQIKQFPQARKAIDVGDYYADASSIGRLTGWVPKTTLREGLAKTLQFYRANLDYYL